MYYLDNDDPQILMIAMIVKILRRVETVQYMAESSGGSPADGNVQRLFS